MLSRAGKPTQVLWRIAISIVILRFGKPMAKELTRIVLFAPGIQEARMRKPFEELEESLRNELGKDRVRLAYVTLATPNLADVAAEAAEDGVARLRILPLFLTPGGPLEKEIPEQVSVVRAQVPQITVELLKPVGEHPRMRTLLHALAREASNF
jgi:sirohydrochlorin cobaltochelatase